jgi:hypothetical protein
VLGGCWAGVGLKCLELELELGVLVSTGGSLDFNSVRRDGYELALEHWEVGRW